MNDASLRSRLQALVRNPLPNPGSGNTAERHRQLMAVGREDLTLARLAEAHWDAIAILAEAGKGPAPKAIYGVWAAEAPGKSLTLARKLSGADAGYCMTGLKMFCSGAGIVDHALVTAGSPVSQLIDVDLQQHTAAIAFDDSAWKTPAFAETKTSTATFDGVVVEEEDFVGEPGWYLRRPGFWHGACGPAACWAGGAAGLVDYALEQSRDDAHTLAHLGAMRADIWSMCACLEQAGHEIDTLPTDASAARIRARTLRHLIEQACTDVVRRLARAYGPYPLVMHEQVSRRYQELDLYVRQSHAERDLESLGRELLHDGQRALVR